ncbi:HNH endonuclease signature motif containing protein [Actinacidiphila sp. bgisy145]|uniref:HNH endonuclease signature motif containing protein n=1 Tax=Actinacidiphila sp. bgisy145 TaxID=3413792 RepID=UPI003EBED4E1
MAARYTRELLAAAAREEHIDDAVRRCGGRPTPGSRRYLRQKMAEAGFDTSHFATGRTRHTEARLRAAVAASTSVKGVVRRLGISPVGGNQAHISRRVAALGIDTSHFGPPTGGNSGTRRESPLRLRDPARGRVPRQRLRSGMVRSGVVEACAMCGTGTEWNGKPLTLEIDHISGEWWDNRLANLRFLCPNCHAVTDTYRGRRRR